MFNVISDARNGLSLSLVHFILKEGNSFFFQFCEIDYFCLLIDFNKKETCGICSLLLLYAVEKQLTFSPNTVTLYVTLK